MYVSLDLQYFAGEKTEKATPKKREDERRKGKVAKSQDVNTAFILFFSFLLLASLGTFLKNQITSLYVDAFTEYVFIDVTISSIMDLLVIVLQKFVFITGPVMLVVAIAAVLANMIQVGVLFTAEPLKMDAKKMDPISGAKRIFSLRALVELLKSLFKIAIIGSITFSIIWMYKDEMMQLAFKSPATSAHFFGQLTMTMGVAVTVALLFLAILDYVYQKYDFEKNIRMSKQDIKDEHKNMEGDPLIKSKLKEKQRQMTLNRMMQEVPGADVIVTNPTHYAVAIRYDEQQALAPIIVAKGADKTAERIKKTATDYHVPMVENKFLARSLYEEVDINEAIPEAFYQAVAEVLAFVYQTAKKVH